MNSKGVTAYHAKYLAAQIRREIPVSSVERLVPIIYDTDIEIHPHQIVTANKILNSPVSSGFILADQNGMGKSIEATIAISWLWNAGSKKQLIIAPVSQVNMWRELLLTSFSLPVQLLNREYLESCTKKKIKTPLNTNNILICTYKFMYEYESLFENEKWDLVVIDEAHRLKDIYGIKSVIGDSIRKSVFPYKKILITSTPFQSSMQRLFRLASMVDKYVFGDQRSYSYQFVNIADNIDYKNLKNRLSGIMSRTEADRVPSFIRKGGKYEIQVVYECGSIEKDYITAMTNYFIDTGKFGFPSEKASLQSEALYKQMTLSPKIAMGGLGIIDRGLDIIRKGKDQSDFVISEFAKDIETLEWVDEEWLRDKNEPLDILDFKSIQKDIDKEKQNILLLREYILAVKKDSRINALFAGLEKAEAIVKNSKGKKKIVIFTESLEAQKYLAFMLRDAGKKSVYTINGKNTDSESEKIYKEFLKNDANSHMITGIEELDRRKAIMEQFNSDGYILIATDKGMSDQVLKDTSVLINYDIPINPYMTQLRISRVHGHFSTSDLIIVNIVNKNNEFELWSYEKQRDIFEMFSGPHGSSDMAVGAIGTGADYAMLMFGYYMRHHSIHLVERAYSKMSIQIKDATSRSMRNYYTKLLLKPPKDEIKERNEVMEEFNSKMDLFQKGIAELSTALDTGDENESEERNFYVNSGIGQKLIDKALTQKLPTHHLRFKLGSKVAKDRSIQHLKGKNGILNLKLLKATGLQNEEYLLFTGITDDGKLMTQIECETLMGLPADDLGLVKISNEYKQFENGNIELLLDSLKKRDTLYIEEFARKIDVWTSDRILVHRRDLRLIMTERRKLHRRIVNSSSKRKQESLEDELLNVGVFRRKKIRYIRNIGKTSSTEKEMLLERFMEGTKYRYKTKELFTIKWSLN